jgi:hypothetical protein
MPSKQIGHRIEWTSTPSMRKLYVFLNANSQSD